MARVTYFTNFTKTPLEMLLGLLNNDNNFSLTPDDVAVRNVAVITHAPSGKPYNTSIEIDLLTNEVTDDFATFYYNRVDLVTLFSLIDPKIRQVDVPTDPVTGLPTDYAVFTAELLRKFGVAFNPVDFDFTTKYATTGIEADKAILVITANDENVSYIGSVEVDVLASLDSLATRVATTQLDGFYAPV